jgi:hypothetical protein
METTGVSNAQRGREQLEVGFNQRDMDGILKIYDENPLFVDHTLNVTLTSIDEIREYVLGRWAAASKEVVEITELFEAGNWTIARFVSKGVHDGPFGDLEPTNRPFEIELWTMTRWRDGKIVEDHVYYDLYGFMAQIGLAEPLTAAPQAG